MHKLLPILLFAVGFALTTEDIYDNSYALIIGIDKYENVPNLDYAVKDANSVASLLKDNFNFPSENVKILLNDEATLINVKNSLEEISLSAKVNDRVLIYFAGHGETDDLPDGGEMGYLLPIDGKRDRLFSTSVPMDDLKRISSMSASKHMLFLIDACYGGLAATGARGLSSTTPNYIDKITNDKSRQIITAGGRGEKVIEKSKWGHSAFTMNLMRALKNGKGDLNDDGYITGDELGLFLKEKVTIDSGNQQTPQSRRFSSHEGEFVFINNAYIEKQIINITPANEKAIISESALLERISTLEEELSKPVKFIQGCTNEMALNYNPDANLDDNSCIILDANEANIRFGSYSSIDSTIEIFLQTGIGSVNLEQISFITVGFTINEIISGKFIKNDYTIEIQHIDDYSSEVVFYSNEYSTTFNTNYSEKLLFVAKVTGFTDTFCLSNIVVNPPSQMSSTRLPSGLFKELADGLIIQNTPCKKNVIASKDFPVPDDLVLEDIILFKNIDYYESIVRFTFYTSGLDWNKLDIMIQGTKLNGEIELDSLKYTGFVYDWVLMEINIEEFRNSNVCIIKAVLEDDEGNTKKLNAGNCERF